LCIHVNIAVLLTVADRGFLEGDGVALGTRRELGGFGLTVKYNYTY